MNIYDFFNSPDVAKHCQSIGHKFNAVEAAVMVSQSASHTLAEKHKVYRAIIAEYPDMELPRGNNHEYHESFHKALGELIACEERMLEQFMKTEQDTVYMFNNEENLFSDYKKTLEGALDYYKDENNQTARIYKRYINSKKRGASVGIRVAHSVEIMDIDGCGGNDIESLLDIYIDVPVPFKKGNLVEITNYKDSISGDVFIIQNICRDDTERNARNLYRSDLIDMTAGIYYECNDEINCEVMHFYPDLQYCKRELEGEQRILKYISLYIQEKICLCTLLKIQKYLYFEKNARETASNGLKYDLEQIGDDLFESEENYA
jgi:hypothetical protein